MELTARLTADAVEATAKGGAKVIQFTVVDNDSYKPKGASEYKKVATFFACSYWQGGKVASVLRKGAILTLQGRVGVRAFLSKDEPSAELTFHVNGFKVLQYAKREEQFTDVVANYKTAQQDNPAGEDDLPF